MVDSLSVGTIYAEAIYGSGEGITNINLSASMAPMTPNSAIKTDANGALITCAQLDVARGGTGSDMSGSTNGELRALTLRDGTISREIKISHGGIPSSIPMRSAMTGAITNDAAGIIIGADNSSINDTEANREYVSLAWDSSKSSFTLATAATGTGIARPLTIAASAITVDGPITVPKPTNAQHAARLADVTAAVLGISWQRYVLAMVDDIPINPSIGDRYIAHQTIQSGSTTWNKNFIYEWIAADPPLVPVACWNEQMPYTGWIVYVDGGDFFADQTIIYNDLNEWVSMGISINHDDLLNCGAIRHADIDTHILTTTTDPHAGQDLRATASPAFSAITLSDKLAFSSAPAVALTHSRANNRDGVALSAGFLSVPSILPTTIAPADDVIASDAILSIHGSNAATNIPLVSLNRASVLPVYDQRNVTIDVDGPTGQITVDAPFGTNISSRLGVGTRAESNVGLVVQQNGGAQLKLMSDAAHFTTMESSADGSLQIETSGSSIETHSAIIARNDVRVMSATESTGPANGALTVAGGAGINGNANVAKDLSVLGTSKLSGPVDVSGAMHAEQDVTIDGRLSVSRAIAAASTIDAVGAISSAATMSAAGSMTASNFVGTNPAATNTFAGPISAGTTITSTGDIASGGSISAAGSMTAVGAMNVGTNVNAVGSILAGGKVRAEDQIISSAALTSTSASTGAIVAQNGGIATGCTANATSSTNGGALTVAGGAAFAKSVYVGNNANITGQVISGGRTTTAAITTTDVIAQSTFAGPVALQGPITVGGKSTLDGIVEIGNDTTIDGNVHATGNAIIDGSLSANNLSIGTNVSAKVLTLNGTVASTDPSTGTLVLSGANAGLGVAGAINAGGSMTANGNINSGGSASVAGALNTGGIIKTTDATQSTSTSTGAIVAPNGGLGVGGNMIAGGAIKSLSGYLYAGATTPSTGALTGAIFTPGGIGASDASWFGSTVQVASIIDATATGTAALATSGGLYIAKNAIIGSTDSATALQVNGGITTGSHIYANAGNAYVQGIMANNSADCTALGAGPNQFAGGVSVGRSLYVGNTIYAKSTAQSYGTGSGSIISLGGIGAVGNVYAGGAIISLDATASTSTSTGAIVAQNGGIGTTGAINAGGYIRAASNIITTATTPAIDSTSGSGVFYGGVGIGGRLYVGSTDVATTTGDAALVVKGGIASAANIRANGDIISNAGEIATSKTTPSTSALTGAIHTLGGIGAAAASWFGSTVYISGTTTIGSGMNVSGRVSLGDGTGATSSTDGALIVSGGIASNGKSYFGNNESSTSATTGGIVVSGGIGTSDNIYAAGIIKSASSAQSINTTSGAIVAPNGGLGVGGAINSGGAIKTLDTAQATAVGTGAINAQNGGISAAKNIIAGGTFTALGSGTNTFVGPVSISSGALDAFTVNGRANISADAIIGGALNVAGAASLGSNVAIAGATLSNSPSTGALVLTGTNAGLGVAGAINAGGAISTQSSLSVAADVYVGGNLSISGSFIENGPVIINDTTASTSPSTGALIVAGGAGVQGALNVGNYIRVNASVASTSPSTGALVLSGTNAGLGVAGAINAGGNAIIGGLINSTGSLTVMDTAASTSATSGSGIFYGGVGIGGALNVANKAEIGGIIHTASTAVSYGPTTGSIISDGGAGIAGALNVGNYIRANAATAAISKTTGAIVAQNGGIGANGNIYGATMNAAGDGTPTVAAIGSVLRGWDTKNSSVRATVQNLSHGTSASSDFIAYIDDATDSNGYIDIGINGSTYSNSGWTINGARDGYAQVAGGNLAIGTSTSGKNIALFTGGTLASNARMAIIDGSANSAYVNVKPTTISTGSSFGALVVDGGVGIKATADASSSAAGGALTVAGGGAFGGSLYIAGTVYAANASILANISASTISAHAGMSAPNVSATTSISAPNITATTKVSAPLVDATNITFANATGSGQLNMTGPITSGSNISASGSVQGSSVASTGTVSVGTNITVGGTTTLSGPTTASSINANTVAAATSISAPHVSATTSLAVGTNTAMPVSNGTVACITLDATNIIADSSTIDGIISSQGMDVRGPVNVYTSGVAQPSTVIANGTVATETVKANTVDTASLSVGNGAATIANTGQIKGTSIISDTSISAVSGSFSDTVAVGGITTTGSITAHLISADGITVSNGEIIAKDITAAHIVASGAIQGSSITSTGTVSASNVVASNAVTASSITTSSATVSTALDAATVHVTGAIDASTIVASTSITSHGSGQIDGALNVGGATTLANLNAANITTTGTVSASTLSAATANISGDANVVGNITSQATITGATLSGAAINGTTITGTNVKSTGTFTVGNNAATISAAGAINAASITTTGAMVAGTTMSANTSISAPKIAATTSILVGTGTQPTVAGTIAATNVATTSVNASGTISGATINASTAMTLGSKGVVVADAVLTASTAASGARVSLSAGPNSISDAATLVHKSDVSAGTSAIIVNNPSGTNSASLSIGPTIATVKSNVGIIELNAAQAATSQLSVSNSAVSTTVPLHVDSSAVIAGVTMIGTPTNNSSLTVHGPISTSSSATFGASISGTSMSLSDTLTVAGTSTLHGIDATTANISGALSSASISTIGDAQIGNNMTAKNIYATGSIHSAASISADESITCGNLESMENVVAHGTISAETIVATTSVSANTINADGSVFADSIILGDPTAPAVSIDSSGSVNASTIDISGATTTNSLSVATGAAIGGNVSAANLYSSGALTGHNLNIGSTAIDSTSGISTPSIAAGTINASGAATFGANISSAGTISAQNLTATTAISTPGTISGSTINSSGVITAIGAITSQANISAAGISTSGQITAQTLSVGSGGAAVAGDISASGIKVLNSDGNIVASINNSGAIHSNTIVADTSISTAGNVSAATISVGNTFNISSNSSTTTFTSAAQRIDAHAIYVSNPIVDESQLTTKEYVDSVLMGLSWIKPVNAFWEFSSGLPNPLIAGARYIAISTRTVGSQIFTKGYIYQYSGSAWVVRQPSEGSATYITSDASALYANQSVVYGTDGEWVPFSSTTSYDSLVGRPNQASGALNVTGSPVFANVNITSDVNAKNATMTGQIKIQPVSGIIPATGLGTGALQVVGGASITDNLYVGGSINFDSSIVRGTITVSNIYINGTTPSTSSTTGVLISDGGIAIKCATNASSATNGGALSVVGGAAFGSDIYVGGNAYLLGRSVFGSGAVDTSARVSVYSTVGSETPLVIHGTTSQTADLFAVRDSAGTKHVSISPSGSLLAQSGVDSTSVSTGALRVIGGAGITGALFAKQMSAALSSDAAPTLSNATFSGWGNANSSVQINVKNYGSGSNASSDIVATSDIGTDTSDYVAMGIGNTGYAKSGWTVSGAHDGYMYARSGALAIGTAAAGKSLSLFTGGTSATDNLRMTIAGDTKSSAYVSIDATTPATSRTNGALRVAGGASIDGAIYAKELNVAMSDDIRPSFAHSSFRGWGRTDDYMQINIQNLSSTSRASSDIVATSDIGNDAGGFVNMGINSSAWSRPTWTINGASDAYLYCAGGHMAVGTSVGAKNVDFFTGGTLLANKRMSIVDGTNPYVSVLTGTASASKSDGAFRVIGGAGISGDVHADRLYAWRGTTGVTSLPGSIIEGIDNVNGFAQLNIQNTSATALASGDVVVSADNGTNTDHFVDFGINSSAYSDPTWTMTGANDGYAYCAGGDMVIGATSAGRVLRLFTGGQAKANERITITDSTVSILPTTHSTSSSNGALVSAGGISIRDTTNASSAINGGALTVAGGAGFNGDVYINGSTTINGQLNALGGISAIDITCTQLASAIASATLTVGRTYRLTDYRTAYTIPGTTETYNCPIEVLRVEAIGAGAISGMAVSESYPTDAINYVPPSANYSYGNISRRVDTARVISALYDWRTVKYRRWFDSVSSQYTITTNNGAASADYYTFNDADSGFVIIESDISANTIFMSTATNVSLGAGSRNNTFVGAVANATIGKSFTSNVALNTFSNATIEDSCSGNQFKAAVDEFTLGPGCVNNIFSGAISAGTTLGSNVADNTFGALSAASIGSGYTTHTCGAINNATIMIPCSTNYTSGLSNKAVASALEIDGTIGATKIALPITNTATSAATYLSVGIPTTVSGSVNRVAMIASTATTTIPLAIQGYASQTADLFQVQNSAATSLVSVAYNGVLRASCGTSSSGKTNGALVVSGGAGISGTVYANTLYATGTGTTTVTNTGTRINAWDSLNSYVQINVQNKNATALASSDIVATNNTGNDTTGFVDFGINGSAYSDASWTVNGANDGYAYCVGGDLSVGTATSGMNLEFFTGGTLFANRRMIIVDGSTTTSYVSIIGTTPATSKTSGVLRVAGGLGIAGSVYADRLYARPTDASAPMVDALGSYDGTASIAIQNSSTGTGASSDFMALANDSGYVDFGINNSGFSLASWTSTAAHDGYAYCQGGNFVFGTNTPAKIVKFITGGSTTACVRATITDTSFNILPTTTSVDSASGALIVAGGIGVSCAVDATSTLYGGALTVAGGAAFGKSVFVGGNLSIKSTTEATDAASGALVVSGGAGFTNRVYAPMFVSSSDTIVTSGGSTTLTATSAANQIFIGTASQTVLMPDTTKLLGAVITITNQSSGLLTIQDRQGGAITNVPVGTTCALTCINNSGTGTWLADNIQKIVIRNTTDAVSVSDGGSWTTLGGAAVGKNFYVGATMFAAGNTAATSKTSGSLIVSGGAGISGSVYASSFFAAGSSDSAPVFANALYTGWNNVNASTQYCIKNYSTGTNASSDIVAVHDSGTDSYGYVAMGINGTGFNSTSWSINGPRDGYLYAKSDNLAIGTAASGKALKFFTGGTLDANNSRMTIVGDTKNSAYVSIDATTSGGNAAGTGAFRVAGSASISGALYVGNGLRLAGSFDVDQITVRGQTQITSSAASTSTQTGALIVSGGFGIGGDIYSGGVLSLGSSSTAVGNATKLLVGAGAQPLANTRAVIYAEAATNVPLAIMGTSSQTANFFEARLGSFLNPIMYIGSAGQIVSGCSVAATSPSTGAIIATGGGIGSYGDAYIGGAAIISGNSANPVVASDLGTGHALVVDRPTTKQNNVRAMISSSNSTVVPLAIQGAASQSADYFKVQDSTGTDKFRIASDGTARISATTSSTNTTSGALTVAGGIGVSGTANVARLSVGNTSASTNANNTLLTVGEPSLLFDDARVLIASSSGQTALVLETVGNTDFFRAVNSTGTVLAGIAATGAFSLANTMTVAGNTTINSTINASSATDGGALTVAGGAAIAADMYIGNSMRSASVIIGQGIMSGANLMSTSGISFIASFAKKSTMADFGVQITPMVSISTDLSDGYCTVTTSNGNIQYSSTNITNPSSYSARLKWIVKGTISGTAPIYIYADSSGAQYGSITLRRLSNGLLSLDYFHSATTTYTASVAFTPVVNRQYEFLIDVNMAAGGALKLYIDGTLAATSATFASAITRVSGAFGMFVISTINADGIMYGKYSDLIIYSTRPYTGNYSAGYSAYSFDTVCAHNIDRIKIRSNASDALSVAGGATIGLGITAAGTITSSTGIVAPSAVIGGTDVGTALANAATHIAATTIDPHAGQDLRATASPSFAGLLVGGVDYAASIASAVAHIATTSTDPHAGQDLRVGASPTFANATITNSVTATGATIGGYNVVTNMAAAAAHIAATTTDPHAGQDLRSTASPSFAGATITSLTATNATLGSINAVSGLTAAATHIATTDTDPHAGQDLRATASPSFAGATIGGHAVASELAASVAHIATTTTDPHAGQDLRSTASPSFAGAIITSLTATNATLGSINAVSGLTAAAAHIATTTTDPHAGQDLRATASPSFAGATITSLTATNATLGSINAVSGLTAAAAHIAATTTDPHAGQDLRSTASPTFAGLTTTSATIGGHTVVSELAAAAAHIAATTTDPHAGQDLRATATPSFAGATITSLTATNATLGSINAVSGLTAAATHIATTDTDPHAGQDLRATATPTWAGATIGGENAATVLASARTHVATVDIDPHAGQDLRATAIPTFADITIGEVLLSDIMQGSSDHVATTWYDPHAGQDLRTTAAPTFAGLSVDSLSVGGSDYGTTITAAAAHVATTDTDPHAGQDLRTTASPSFAGLVVGGVNYASTLTSAAAHIAATTTDPHAGQDLRSTATPTFAGATIGGYNAVTAISAAAAHIAATTTDPHAGQDLRATASPTFAGLTTTSATIGGHTVVSELAAAAAHIAATTTDPHAGQDLRATATPTWAGATLTGALSGTTATMTGASTLPTINSSLINITSSAAGQPIMTLSDAGSAYPTTLYNNSAGSYVISNNGGVRVLNTAESTSPTNGSFTTGGGIGIGGSIINNGLWNMGKGLNVASRASASDSTIVFAASYLNSADADIGAAPTATSSGCSFTNGSIVMNTSTSYARYALSTTIPNKDAYTVRWKWTATYSGAPSSNVDIFNAYTATQTVLRISHLTNGNLSMTMGYDIGSYTATYTFSPTVLRTYEFAVVMNGAASNYILLFVDGTGFIFYANPAGASLLTPTNIAIGVSPVGSLTAAGAYKDLIIYNGLRYGMANYTAGYSFFTTTNNGAINTDSLVVSSTLEASATSNGAASVAGGANIGKSLMVGGTASMGGHARIGTATTSLFDTLGFVGQIAHFATLKAPTGWLVCNGSAVSRTTYAALFSALYSSATVTITVASPGIISWTNHGLSAGMPVRFTTTGALPTGITAGTTYYVIATGITTSSFCIATTADGTAINTSGTQSGTHTAICAPYGIGDGSTTFNLPDLRGEFLRGFDYGRGIDASHGLGALQTAANLSHTHTASTNKHVHAVGYRGVSGHGYGTGSGSTWTDLTSAVCGVTLTNFASKAGAPVTLTSTEATSITTPSTGHTHTLANDGTTEARPRNVATLICIKY